MGTRFQPDWVKDQTLPPNWSLEYRPEAPGNKKWELMRGEGHYRMFQFHEDAILEARKQELADIESGAIAVPPAKPIGLHAVRKTVNVRGTTMYEVLIYDGEEPLAYAGGATFTPEKAKEEALAVYKRRIVGAEVELRNVQKRIDDMKAIINSIKELPDA